MLQYYRHFAILVYTINQYHKDFYMSVTSCVQCIIEYCRISQNIAIELSVQMNQNQCYNLQIYNFI